MSGYSVPVFAWLYQGQVAALGQVYVYKTGTTTLQTIYSDGGLTTPLSNPLTLDANGQCKFYVTGANILRLDGYTASGALIQSIDPVYPVGSTSVGTIVYQSGNFTLSSTNAGNNIISTTPITIFLPLSNTFTNSFSIQLNAQGGAITLSPNAADRIQQGSLGATYVLSTGTSAELWTDAAGNWGINYFSLGSTAAQINNTLKAFLTIKRQQFISTGTYTPSAGMVYCNVQMWAAGGGGGGCSAVSGAVAAGGGAGGYTEVSFSAATIGVSQSITIGAGGVSGSSAGGTGGTGGSVSIGALASASGGVGGQGNTSATASQTGGVGGVGSIQGGAASKGAPGGAAISVNIVACNTSGAGGSTSIGGGGNSVTSAIGTQNGNSATNNTGGGGGGSSSQGSSSVGGVGGSGFVLITEYCTQ